MNKKMPPGVEILGYGTLEPNKYMDSPKKFSCPLKELAATIAGVNGDTYCSRSCAWWNGAKGRCGIINDRTE